MGEALPDHQEDYLICIVVKSLSGMYCIVRLSNNQLFTLPIKIVQKRAYIPIETYTRLEVFMESYRGLNPTSGPCYWQNQFCKLLVSQAPSFDKNSILWYSLRLSAQYITYLQPYSIICEC